MEHATNVFGPRSVLTGKSKQRNHLFVCYCHIHGTWVQQEVTQHSLHKTQRMDILNKLGYLGWRPRVGCLLVEFLYLTQTMN